MCEHKPKSFLLNLWFPRDLLFTTYAQDGAVLVMPDGAVSEDLTSTDIISTYVARNAKSWYGLVTEARGIDIGDGEIRLVVGVDKVSTWGIATFSQGTGDSRLEFKFEDNSRGDPPYRWYAGGHGHGRVGPREMEMSDLRQTTDTPLCNQCIFMRTLNYNIRGDVRQSDSLDYSHEDAQLPSPGSFRQVVHPQVLWPTVSLSVIGLFLD